MFSEVIDRTSENQDGIAKRLDIWSLLALWQLETIKSYFIDLKR